MPFVIKYRSKQAPNKKISDRLKFGEGALFPPRFYIEDNMQRACIRGVTLRCSVLYAWNWQRMVGYGCIAWHLVIVIRFLARGRQKLLHWSAAWIMIIFISPQMLEENNRNETYKKINW